MPFSSLFVSRIDFVDWLRRDNVQRCALVEIDYVVDPNNDGNPETRTLRYSDMVYLRDFTNSWEDCINSVPQYTRTLSGPVASTYSSSFGSVEIDNADGDKDFILALTLDGSEVRVYLGDVEWNRGQFILMFTALAVKASAPSFDRISIPLKDGTLLLNKSLGGVVTIGGTGPNKDQWRPINFGYVHNLQAKVQDEGLLIYVHSDTGTNTAALDVRDRGVPVTFTDNADGTFTLSTSPAGIITCDVLATRDNTGLTCRVSDFMEFMIKGRSGVNAAARGAPVLDSYYYASAGPTYFINDDQDYFIALSVPDARNVIDILNQMCDSGLCFWAVTRTGAFTYGRLRPGDIDNFGYVAAEISEDDYDEGSWKLDHALPQYYQLQAFMSRNWTEQTDFAGSVTPDQQASYRRKGIYLLQPHALGSPVYDTYFERPELYDKTLSISPAIDTLLSGGLGDGDLPYLEAWEDVRLAMQLPWLESVSITVGLEFFYLELGDPVVITTARYGLDTGVLFQVTSININITRAKVDLTLLRRLNPSIIPQRIRPPTGVLLLEGQVPLVLNSELAPYLPATGSLILTGQQADIPTGGGDPEEEAVNFAYVANTGNFSTTVIDWVNDANFATVAGTGSNVGDARYLAVMPDDTFVYVTSFGDHNVYKFDAATLSIVNIIDVGSGIFPEHIAITPGGEYVWCTCPTTHNVAIINTVDDSVTLFDLTTDSVGPRAVVFGDPLGGGLNAYVACDGDGINLRVAVVSAVLSAPNFEGFMDTFGMEFTFPDTWGACIVADATLYVSMPTENAVQTWDITTGILGTWNPGGGGTPTIVINLDEVGDNNPQELTATRTGIVFAGCNESIANGGGIWDVTNNVMANNDYPYIRDLCVSVDDLSILATANADDLAVRMLVSDYSTAATIATQDQPIGVRAMNRAHGVTGNDFFANAFTIHEAGTVTNKYRVWVDNQSYNDSAEAGEPTVSAASETGSRTAWWKFTPTSNYNVSFDTHDCAPHPLGGSFPPDTVLALYEDTDSTITGLSEIASNDDSGDGTSEIGPVAVTSGTTYYVKVGMFASGDPALYRLKYSLGGATT